MTYDDPDSKDIMIAIAKIEKQIEELRQEIHQSQRLSSPEHIAQLAGYVQIKDDLKEIKKALPALDEIKKSLSDLSRRTGR